MRIAIGFLLAIAIGAICRLADISVPAPPAIVGAVLVVAMTAGYLVMDRIASHRPKKHEHLCGGPSGNAAEKEK